MFLYSCGNYANDYDLETPCGCVGFMHKVMAEADTASMERLAELDDMFTEDFENCKKVIAVFEQDEIGWMVESNGDIYLGDFFGYIEEAIMNTDHFNGCEETAIEVSPVIWEAMVEFLDVRVKSTFEVLEDEFGGADKELGSHYVGDSVNATYTIKNKGDSDLLIKRLEPSCSCVDGSFTEEPIEPGKSGEITLRYNVVLPNDSFQKTAEVLANVEDEMYELRFEIGLRGYGIDK